MRRRAASAAGGVSCRADTHSVLFTSATELIAALAKAETDGQLAERLTFYSKPKLLLIDEFGYLPFERRSAHLFVQLVAPRYERGRTLITTNQLVTQWGTVFGDEVLAAAILARLPHHSYTLLMQGESCRLRQEKKAGLLGQSPRREACPRRPVRPVVLGGGTDRPACARQAPRRRTAQNDRQEIRQRGPGLMSAGVNFSCRLTRGPRAWRAAVRIGAARGF